jgi:hypothetical protein
MLHVPHWEGWQVRGHIHATWTGLCCHPMDKCPWLRTEASLGPLTAPPSACSFYPCQLLSPMSLLMPSVPHPYPRHHSQPPHMPQPPGPRPGLPCSRAPLSCWRPCCLGLEMSFLNLRTLRLSMGQPPARETRGAPAGQCSASQLVQGYAMESSAAGRRCLIGLVLC